MIIDNFSLPGIAVLPSKANAPLPIDTYAVLPLALAGENFEPVAGRNAQIIKRGCGIQE